MRVKVHTREGPLHVGNDFRWFFDTEDLVPGDILILLGACLRYIPSALPSNPDMQ